MHIARNSSFDRVWCIDLLGITDKNNIIDYYNKDLKFYKKDLDINIKKIKEVVPKLENHYDFLKKMGGFNE